ncbi:YbhB/YbcL family Raf kinase inhibitor-like protein [Lactococcus hodotermopsidis]|uniref:YbhB/YbcL family Raf kinase inhibitor-like protein n=1 Tax=Pseudolactococcus hodotermopsidis TaxID=2709157 RepID=A0A6A0BH07_9LACT|nr:YbhB/YbcL family Raf kinase inhibitor-like protein [Lactococcus hodotermopsidis]GFH43067.1 YbhB/YbcL family Raf kinase inhibitor-like protein [Lactococcus hodotermopsidis]
MKLTIKKDENGFLPDKYAKFAADDFKSEGHPIVSFPFDITEIPETARFLSWSLVDYDAVVPAGFPWIHWLVANVAVASESLEIPEDFSRTTSALQGKNTNVSRFLPKASPAITEHYTGPTPPDKNHDYQLIVYAHSEPLDLKSGFFLNELMKEANAKALDSVVSDVTARA